MSAAEIRPVADSQRLQLMFVCFPPNNQKQLVHHHLTTVCDELSIQHQQPERRSAAFGIPPPPLSPFSQD